jgi:predicted PurR-regulated permease PerM
MEKNRTTVDISTKSIFKIFGVLLLIIFLYIIKDVLAIFLISLIIVTALGPIVKKMYGFKIPKSLTILSIYIIFFGGIGFLIYTIIPQLGSQIKELSKDIPNFVNQFNQIFGQLPQHEEIAKGAENALKNFGDNLGGSTSNIFAPVASVFGGVVTFFIVLILTLYMSVAEDEIKKFFQTVFPKRFERKIETTIIKIQEKIGQWVRGQFFLMFVVGLLTFVGLTLLGVKFALTLAIIAGLLELIPFVGPTVAAIPAVIIAFTQSPLLGLLTLGLCILIQQFENHVLVPKIMEKTTGISPVVVVLALLIGAKLLGLLGIFLAVPVAVILSVFVEDVLEKQAEK